MRFWIWLGRVRSPFEFTTKLVLAVGSAAVLNHIRALVMDWPDHHDFLTSLTDAAFVAVPLGILFILLLNRMGRLQDELARLASTDPLTGLCNRRVFMQNLEHALRNGAPVTLLMADVDRFKRINDTFGHGGGDTCLIRIADRMRDICGADHPFARIGGEEFAVLVQNGDQEVAQHVAEAIVQGIELDLSAPPFRVTLSVGVAAAQSVADLETLMHRADEALYYAKRNGRARAVAWTPDGMSDPAQELPAAS